ncbi:aldehyde dehydrogenase family protein [Bradyrhizobium sp.]|uniref:aldehyde dehydrogenase family protein n=1 Tax=Bradyrhizobium sp. TaxID=376 RepID=UPI0025C2B7AD|nr:aldehyde dehydrogenase family protein [Bradyrhizobium sp.]
MDKDLKAIQQARRLAERCREAQREFAKASSATVNAVCEAASQAAFKGARRLAQMAHEETGYGNPEHKVLKNEFAARNVWESIRGVPTVGIIERDEANKVIVMAEPMGVVAALTPSTNPTSTAIFKSLIALKGGNGIIFSPHPSAAKCTAETVDIIARAAEAAGAPAGLVSCLDGSSYAGTQELLRHYAVNVILATGGGPMVRAAHSTGKPAYGVGPGNVPAWVDRSADIAKAARDLVNSKSFDCSLICATEQAVIADEPIAAELRSRMEDQGAYWVPEAYRKKLAAVLFHPDGSINPRSVGQTAAALANVVSMEIPASTRVLVVPLGGIGKDYPFSREKLTSVLGFATARDAQAGLELCVQILRFGGDGHSAVIHSLNVAQTEHMAAQLPAFRVIVNSMSSLGSIGYTCRFPPSLTLGTGGMGGAIVGDNITVTHLINRKCVAWEVASPPASVQLPEATVTGREPGIDEIVAQVLARLGRTSVAA